MFKHSAHYCTGYTDECIQPNALDITLDQLELISGSEVILSKDGTTHAIKYSTSPYAGYFHLSEGSQYSFTSNIFCKIPEGVVGWLVSRSSLNRNGIFILSGVYDSGFNGHVGGTIYTNRPLRIEVGTRVAQLITAEAEAFHSYDGQYQS